MVKTIIRVITSLWLFSYSVSAQVSDSALPLPFPTQAGVASGKSFCGADLLLNTLRKSPAFLKAEEEMNLKIAMATRLLNEDTIVLPVVFHVLADDPFAIPDEELKKGLAELNDAFAKRGAWAGSKGVDTKIRFCLARKDPDGGNTTGITRVVSHWGNHVNPLIEDAKMKASAQWDPARYINIWYVRQIDQEGIVEFSCGVWTRSGIAGYATMPPGGSPTDGIVITAFGLLLAHEMGHYLGLYHTFEGYCNNTNCTLNGDRVCDTPPDGSYRFSSCNNPENSCHTDTLSNYSNGNFTKDVDDPINNIMDYGNPACQNAFTQGQADRMINAINTMRKGLLEPKCEMPCADQVFAGFRRNIAHPKQGDEVAFTNTSAGTISWQWLVDGVPVSTAENFKYTFTGTGRFRITLKAFRNNNCYGSFSEYVTVDCGVAARFYTNKHLIASKEIIYQDTILFTNNSFGATAYQWLVSHDKGMAEQVVSTNRNLPFMFPIPAIYSIRLIASNGTCRDTTLPYIVNVQDPTTDAGLVMTGVHCSNQTSIRVNFYVCNFSYDTLPAQTPISFYDADPRQAGAKKIGTTFFMPSHLTGNCCTPWYSHTIDVGYAGLNQIYAVVNDNGSTIPLQLPNTGVAEKSYPNNLQVQRNFQFRIVPVPASVTMEPGDTFRLSAYGTPTTVLTYKWSGAERLSCTDCNSPFYVADTNRLTTKRVIGTSIFNCYDTAYLDILVPPYNDFRIRIDSAECAGNDSMQVHFTLFNDFKRGVLPRGLTVRFYNNNPAAAGSAQLGLPFILKDSVYARNFHFSSRINRMDNGTLYAVVNDSLGVPPIVLPNTWLEEKLYTNNTGSYNYTRLNLTALPVNPVLEPGDTVLLTGQALPGSGIQYVWSTADKLSCTNCEATLFIADTNRLTAKRVIATNRYACKDTAFVQISVPPYHDFRMRIDSAECAGSDSIRVGFTLYNDFKRGVLPKGLTVRFYAGNPAAAGAVFLPPSFILRDTVKAKEFNFTTSIKSMPSGDLYAVVNDSAGAPPIVLPNTWLEEKNYGNNTGLFAYQRLKTTVTPLTGLIEPYDTLQLAAAASPGPIKSFTWSPAYNLSCHICADPVMIADTTTVKRVIAENSYGCRDTAFLDVFIPPSDDFTIRIDEAECAANDSMQVSFTVQNLFRRGVLLKGLTVRFYDKDPRQAGAAELLPAYVLSAMYPIRSRSFSTRIKNSSSGKLFAVVNDSGTTRPLVLPNSRRLEKEYGNNITEINYTPEEILVNPSDTIVLRSTSITATILSQLDNPGSTRWQTGAGYTLSCTQCVNPIVGVTQSSDIPLTTVNKYGCILNGRMRIQILPPDFTLSINHTECVTNASTRIYFTICMNNGYDTLWKGIPVSFYEGTPGQNNAKLLQTIFVTPASQPGNCGNFQHMLSTPASNQLFAVVNDRGITSTPGPDEMFEETNNQNNTVAASGFRRFSIGVNPSDTTIERSSFVQLFTTVEGGNLFSAQWNASRFLSCTDCSNPVVNPTYTERYIVTGKNEFNCTDTGLVTIRTITVGDIHIPSGFTPNDDNLNDIFYVMGSERISVLKDFIIYTRWGDKVFEAHNIPPNDPVYGWKGLVHGQKGQAGAYVYQVSALMTDGKTEWRKGTVILIP